MKKSILLATSAIIAAGAVASNAMAVDVKMYGQVNKGIMMYDDGRDSEFNIVDNDMSSTRFGVRGSQVLDNGMTASVLFEGQMESDSSSAITQNTAGSIQSTPADTGAANFQERHTRVGLAGDWGAVFVGRTSTATDGVTEVDLGPVGDIMGSATSRMGSALFFRQSSGALSNFQIGEVIDNFDGMAFAGGSADDGTGAAGAIGGLFGNGFGDRFNVVRYDSPIWNGLQARVAVAQGGNADAAVYYNGKFDAFEVAAGVGHVIYNNVTANSNAARNEVESQTSGSISVKHDSGLSLTAAYGERSYDKKRAGTDDPEFYYVKGGYSWDNWGVAVDYGNYDSINVDTAANHSATATGVGVQYDMGQGVSLAGYFRQFDLDMSGVNTDALNVYGVNMRVKF